MQKRHSNTDSIKSPLINQDVKLFSHITEILLMSASGRNDHGLQIESFEHLAVVLEKKGLLNKWGKKITANAIYQMIHRLKKQKEIWNEYREYVLNELNDPFIKIERINRNKTLKFLKQE